MSDAISCPVQAEFLGIDVGACGDPATYEVTFACDGGCVREPRRVCGFHAQLLSLDDESAYCGACHENRIHPTGVRAIGEAGPP